MGRSSGSRSSRAAARARWIPSLDDVADLASLVLGEPPEVIRQSPRFAVAEAVLQAPFVSSGGCEAYPTLTEQAALLLEQLSQSRPLPDGNKRVAFLLMIRFLDANRIAWGSPDADADATMVERIATGAAAHSDAVSWIASRAKAK